MVIFRPLSLKNFILYTLHISYYLVKITLWIIKFKILQLVNIQTSKAVKLNHGASSLH